MSRVLVFAYGSNMHPERMLERVPGAVARGRGRLRGRRFVVNKRGRDGSAKANLADDADGLVWGVLWELTREEVAALDRHEGGYERQQVSIETDEGVVTAETYVSDWITEAPRAHDWYLTHIVRGARAFGFPEDYVAWLADHPSRAVETE